MTWNEILEPVESDGLLAKEVGPWAEEKHRLLAHYASLFVRSMKGKWDILVYLDLFSGPGQCRFQYTGRYYHSSPTIVAGMEEGFSRYIFCDLDEANIAALKTRIERSGRSAQVDMLCGDSNERVEEILARIPAANKQRTVLSLCFLDPYRMANLKFETIRRLADRYMDFLVLIPSGMDAHRNEQHYTQPDNRVMDEFLGNRSWRDRWSSQKGKGDPFERFVVCEFGRAMNTLSYIDPGLENISTIRSREKNLLLYRLALYSRHKLGARFWKETRKYTDPQIGWDF